MWQYQFLCSGRSFLLDATKRQAQKLHITKMKIKEKYKWPEEKPDVSKDYHGWFLDSAADILNSFLNENTQVVVELGSWLGKSTRHILRAAPNATVIAVDHWKGSAEHSQKAVIPILHETFLVNCWNFKDRLIPLKSDTLSGLQEIYDEGLNPDLIYIDAGHDTTSVMQDIMKSVYLFPNAQLVGDDWLWGKNRPVARAVEICAKGFGFEIKVSENTWYYSS